MSLYTKARSLARPLKRLLSEGPPLFCDTSFLSYVCKKRDGLLHHACDTQIVTLGCSTADYGFAPQSGTGAYNLSLTSSDLYTAYHQYKFADTHLEALKHIVIFGAVFTPGLRMAKTNTKYRIVSYHYFLDFPVQDPEDYEAKYVRKIERKCAATGSESGLDDFFGHDKKTFFIVGTDARDRANTHMLENMRRPDQMAWLQRILDKAAASGQKIWIIIPPYRSDYRSALQTRGNFRKILQPEYSGA